jgi:four helix bundle protein
MPYAKSFADLEVYQLAMKLSEEIFERTKKFPKEETYSLIDQIRRSSRSIGAQIAESWAKRNYQRHFISKLTDAEGEKNETQHWLNVSISCGYLDQQSGEDLIKRYSTIGKMLQQMQTKARLFCKTSDR